MKAKEPSPTLEPIQNSAPSSWPYEALKRFRLIFRAVQQHSQWVESRCGVSCAQLWVLAEIKAKPGSRVTNVAKAMAVHQTTVSNLLVKLEKKGLVRRERCQPDQRVVCLFLTAAGEDIVALAPGPQRGLLQQALFELPDPVLASLTGNLDQLIEGMRIRDSDAAMQPLSVAGAESPAP